METYNSFHKKFLKINLNTLKIFMKKKYKNIYVKHKP